MTSSYSPYSFVADYHTHTHHSDGEGSVLDNVAAAVARGLSTVAITDHGPASLFGIGVRNYDVFYHVREEIQRAKSLYPNIRILFGAEANVISDDGELDIPIVMQDMFDVVLVGLHPFVRWTSVRRGMQLVLGNLWSGWTGIGADDVRQQNTRAIVNAVQRNRVHIVTHPGYRLPIDTRRLAAACAETGCVMEISACHDHTTVEYIRIAKDFGARFVVGSDAHTPDRVGDFSKGAEIAAAAGLNPDQIVNAVPR